VSTDEVQNDGVKILLKRMESHPQEFVPSGRWSWIMEPVLQLATGAAHKSGNKTNPLPFLSEVEIRMLYDKYITLQGDWFTRKVLDELFRTNEAYDFGKKFFTVVAGASPYR
jgi:hypothetical protein